MNTWLYAAVVLLVGLGLALFVDRLRGRKGSSGEEPEERNKWLYLWFTGRFPTREEELEERRKQEEKKRKRSGRG